MHLSLINLYVIDKNPRRLINLKRANPLLKRDDDDNNVYDEFLSEILMVTSSS